MAASSKTPPHQSKDPQKFKTPAPSASVPREQSVVSSFQKSAFSKQQMPVCEGMANAKTSQFDISSSHWHHRPYDRFHGVQFVIQLLTP
ncbi:hypothetical protein TNCV_1615351 [Trichonephila clavipes]|nr:hypothetical protein TNCV_1615351 [Trichonephila clavipes]